jgi:putative transposase
MPRANRCFLPDHVWHITHRCHKKEFLLKFARDRRRWLYWLFEARKRFGLCVLNYVVTSNHIHLLVRDRGDGKIARCMQLIAGRTGQEYNQRKGRNGAYWEDRYHATAVDTEAYFARCLVYIDLNMVRAGVVTHPAQWSACGYREVQDPPKRYGIIDLPVLMDLLGLSDLAQLQRTRAQWVEEALQTNIHRREAHWSESLAVGGQTFVEGVKARLGIGARYREIRQEGQVYRLKEPAIVYGIHFEPQTDTLSDESVLISQ